MKLDGTYTDHQLLELLKGQSRAAFTEIYNRYWAVLASFATKLLEDEDEAVDIVQDVFTNIWNASETLDITSSIKSYLYVSVRNRIISKIRHSKVKGFYLDSLSEIYEKGEFVTDEQVRFRELSQQVEMEVSKLPTKMREVFELSRKQGMSHSQIAQELGIADDTVKKQIHKAIKVLRMKLNSLLFSLF
ncbi:RNA polymerase sigma-70 factor [Pedobacter frigoris]|uniref:RNA polymerase sigma-70 factor n=1 Tax=Pedobacter frigoris TaxID=2571272 RepID=A0A4U1CDC6_9SPHI|nr:RNA polymerase sigma-70 factor [Pedobacter frigoris]TKC04322.1 RNA polymerase sigma-70 factor [Pedobacter frigoris]